MRPPRSRVCAARGKAATTSAEGPTAAMRSPATAMAPSRRTRSSPSTVTTSALRRMVSTVGASAAISVALLTASSAGRRHERPPYDGGEGDSAGGGVEYSERVE
nr:unnamed protein product [Digitaria exilis]